MMVRRNKRKRDHCKLARPSAKPIIKAGGGMVFLFRGLLAYRTPGLWSGS